MVTVSRMTSTTVYLTEEQLERLRAASRSRQVPLAVLIREGIEKQLDWEARQAPVSAPA